MNIIVCIKQVPDTTEVKINPATNTLVRDGVPSIMNPYDKHALETALTLKDKYNAKVSVLTMGPLQAKEAIKEAITMGADEGILLSDRAFAGADTLATSQVLASAIRKISDVDLIFCGKQAIDGDTAQVGPELAEHLGIPQVTFAVQIEKKADHLFIQREHEYGTETVQAKMPVLVTVTHSADDVRYGTIKNLLRAQRMEFPLWTVDKIEVDRNKIGLDGSPTQVVKIFTPQIIKSTSVLIEEKNPKQAVSVLIKKLKQANIIR